MSASVFADEATKAPSAAESATPPAKSPAASSEGKPSLGLDSLLRPRGPARAPVKRELPGGRDRDAWKQAFDDTRNEIRDLEAALDKARKEVGERSQGGYQYSPIGGGNDSTPSDPEILKLRAQLRRDKKSLEAAEARLRELQVEASLSGVPDEWTQE
jgi:hypothetical protein